MVDPERFPAGKYTNHTLILCRTRKQCDEVWRAFGIPAWYDVAGALIPGTRFHKIILFRDSGVRDAEIVLGARDYTVHVRGWLLPEGELFEVFH